MACTACGLDIPASALRDEIQAARDALCEAPGPAALRGADREGDVPPKEVS